MMLKDRGLISSVLDFLFKNLEDKRLVDTSQRYEKAKEILGIERMEGKRKIMFYLVNSEELDGKSLLEYIDSQNVRLSRQREELIDLSVKIADLNH